MGSDYFVKDLEIVGLKWQDGSGDRGSRIKLERIGSSLIRIVRIIRMESLGSGIKTHRIE